MYNLLLILCVFLPVQHLICLFHFIHKFSLLKKTSFCNKTTATISFVKNLTQINQHGILVSLREDSCVLSSVLCEVFRCQSQGTCWQHRGSVVGFVSYF